MGKSQQEITSSLTASVVERGRRFADDLYAMLPEDRRDVARKVVQSLCSVIEAQQQTIEEADTIILGFKTALWESKK